MQNDSLRSRTDLVNKITGNLGRKRSVLMLCNVQVPTDRGHGSRHISAPPVTESTPHIEVCTRPKFRLFSKLFRDV
jgi:hypothetical protein